MNKHQYICNSEILNRKYRCQ